MTTSVRPSTFLKTLQPLRTEHCPFTNLPSTKKGHWGEGITADEMSDYTWLRPELVAEIKFAEWSTADVLRHPQFVDLRDDKPPHDVVRENPL